MKAKFGAIVVDGRNKVGGHVFSKNRGGAYMRTKVTPVNPQSSAQTAVRSSLTFLAQSWRGLTATQRASWNGAVESFKRTDIFGDIKTPSGLNLYMRLNLNLANGNATAITTPPAPSTTVAVDSLSALFDVSSTQADIIFSTSPVPAAHSLIIEATAQVSPGKTFLKNQYRVIHVEPAAGTTPVDVYAEYTARFGALVAGQKIGVRVKMLDTTTGLTSLPLVFEAIVTA